LPLGLQKSTKRIRKYFSWKFCNKVLKTFLGFRLGNTSIWSFGLHVCQEFLSKLLSYLPRKKFICNSVSLLILNATECVTDLDQQSKMIIFGLILTTFKSSSIFGGILGSIKNWLNPKTEPPLGNLACPNLWNTL